MESTTGLAAELLDLIAEEDPLNDALEGHPHARDRLADLDEAVQQGIRDRAAVIAVRAREHGPEAERVDRAVVVQQAEAVVVRIDARLVEHTMSGYDHSPLGRLLGALPQVRPSGGDQERDFLDRLAGIPNFLGKAAQRHRTGVAAGRTPVADRVRHAIARIDAYLADPHADPLGLVALSPDQAARRDRLLADVVRPAFAAYQAFLHDEVASHGRPQDRPGLCWLPDGERTYAALAAMHTTTDLSPQRLHEVGAGLVADLAEEYVETGVEAFGLRSADEVRQRMRVDPELRWRDGAEMLAAARQAIGRAEAVAPKWFGRMPAEPCEVVASPDPDGPSAYYLPPALNGTRPGTYFLNVGAPAERARYLAEVTAFHEAVPGHHFQLSLAQGLSELMPLRRLAWVNSYIEGWGLYVERLADEMGLYSGPVARLGVLAMDSLRAARLVVDTGLHAFGWGRRRAVDYLVANTMLTESEARGEADRYIEFPGQALSYMVGRVELQRLRARSEGELGARFDIRAFHDVVLGGGALPLAVLDGVVADWSARMNRSR
jgi:uncharacterized protein (DUF885 family)